MGIAHRHAGYLISLALHRQRTVFDFAVGIDGDFAPFENRFAHVDFDQIADDLWPDDAGQCFHFDLVLLRDAMVVDIFGETADAVAAHLHLAAVGVVDLHLEVGDLRRMHRQQLIRADAETAVAEPLGDRLRDSAMLFFRQSRKTKSLPAPCILVNCSSITLNL